MSLLRFTNADGQTIDFRTLEIHAERIEGAEAPTVETTLIPVVARPGEGYVRRHVDPRIITITFNAMAGVSSSMVALRSEISSGLSPSLGLGVLEYTPLDATTVYAIDATVKRLAAPYVRPHTTRYVVQFECPFPYWRDATMNTQQVIVGAGVASDTEVITNGGNVPTWPVVSAVGSGTLGNLVWTNQTTGELMSFTARSSTLTAGQVLTVDHLGFSALVDGTTNWLDRITGASSFWALRKGNNTVQFAGTSAPTKTFDISWYDLFDGV